MLVGVLQCSNVFLSSVKLCWVEWLTIASPPGFECGTQYYKSAFIISGVKSFFILVSSVNTIFRI
jgi:hypothetical protein